MPAGLLNWPLINRPKKWCCWMPGRHASFTDYIVICSGESDRQVDAIHREILDSLKKESAIPYHSEGAADSGWILLDYAGVVMHIFSQGTEGLL